MNVETPKEEDLDAYDHMIVVGRVRPRVHRSINLNTVLEDYGGGGHAKAASASFRLDKGAVPLSQFEESVDPVGSVGSVGPTPDAPNAPHKEGLDANAESEPLELRDPSRDPSSDPSSSVKDSLSLGRTVLSRMVENMKEAYESPDLTARDFMTAPVLTCLTTDSIEKVGAQEAEGP